LEEKVINSMKNLLKFLFVIILLSSITFSQDSHNITRKSTDNIIPVIYIPGIMASPLYDDINNDDKLTVNEKAWVGIKVASLWLNANGIDPAGNYNIKVSPLRNDTANTLRNELNYVPMDLFKGFFDKLESAGYVLDNYDGNHNEGENLFCFTYDWRKFNSSNAALLSGFIDSVLGWTGGQSVNLVAHSMGGIVAKTCIKLFDKSRIRNIVFIGTPHLGAPEMLTVMMKGKLFEWLDYIIEEPVVRSLARNLPSCYELIPSDSYFNTNITNGISSDVDVYTECFQMPGGNYVDYTGLIDYLRTYSSSLGENLNDALIDSSETFKESIDTIDFGEINIFNIVGCNQWTIGKNRVVVGPPPLNWISIEESRNINGDYTVPVRSAELINNQILEHTYYIPDIEHCDMPASQPVFEILTGIFSDPQVTWFPQYSTPPPSYRFIINGINEQTEKINSFYLSQNYPNPFNSSTTIKYILPEASYLTIKIYDILGNEIGILVNGERSAGSYSVKIFLNDPGLASNVYFYRLDAVAISSREHFSSTGKMILLK
jgi:hypothetical protein